MQPVEHIHLEQLLVAHPHLDRVVGWAVLIEPVVDQWHIHRPPCAARPMAQEHVIQLWSCQTIGDTLHLFTDILAQASVVATASRKPAVKSHADHASSNTGTQSEMIYKCLLSHRSMQGNNQLECSIPARKIWTAPY